MLLSTLQRAGIETCGIGKIGDLYAGVGLDRIIPTRDNRAGMEQTEAVLAQQERGLIMTNLVDFDMLYGHRRDTEGFAAALEEVDGWLPRLLKMLSKDDLLVITADHGCDPTAPGTDHTREYVPLLVTSKKLSNSKDLGVRESFADIGQTLAENFGLALSAGHSFLRLLR
jgi:phosphopentomutase